MNYEYAKYVGIIDVIIIILAIIFIILGAKKGFLQKAIKIGNWIFGIIFAFLFCVKFANDVLYTWFGESLKSSIYENVKNNPSFTNITTTEEALTVLESLGIPNFLGNIILANVDAASVVASIADNISNIVTSAVLIVCSFLFLWLGTTLICFVLKILVKILRTSKFIRIIDGILGVVLYIVMLYILIQIVFFVIILIYRNANLEGFNAFVDNDILGVNASFRISRYIFNTNFLANFIALLF